MSIETGKPNYNTRRQFIREAVAARKAITVPIRPELVATTTPKKGLRDVNNINLLAMDAFSNKPFQKIARAQGISRQTATNRRNQGLEILREESPDHIKEKYPLGVLVASKPKPSVGRIKQTLIDRELAVGRSIAEIRRAHGISTHDLGQYRANKRKSGVEPPKDSYQRLYLKRFEQSLIACKTHGDVQSLFDSVTYTVGTVLLNSNQLVQSLGRTLQKFELRFWGRKLTPVVSLLRENGIPVGLFKSPHYKSQKHPIHYYFVDKRDIEEIRQIFKGLSNPLDIYQNFQEEVRDQPVRSRAKKRTIDVGFT